MQIAERRNTADRRRTKQYPENGEREKHLQVSEESCQSERTRQTDSSIRLGRKAIPIEEDDEIIRLNADKTRVCEVNARTVVISGNSSDKRVLERNRATPVNKGDDILNVSGRRPVKTGQNDQCKREGEVSPFLQMTSISLAPFI